MPVAEGADRGGIAGGEGLGIDAAMGDAGVIGRDFRVEIQQVAAGGMRDAEIALRIGDGGLLLHPVLDAQVEAEKLGDHVVDHQHHRRRQRRAVIGRGEDIRLQMVADLLDQRRIRRCLGGVIAREGQAPGAGNVGQAAAIEQDDIEIRARRQDPQHRLPDPGDPGIVQLEEHAVDYNTHHLSLPLSPAPRRRTCSGAPDRASPAGPACPDPPRPRRGRAVGRACPARNPAAAR